MTSVVDDASSTVVVFPPEYESRIKNDASTILLLDEILNPAKPTNTSQNKTPFGAETLKTFFAAGTALIPYVGGALSLIVDTIWTNILESSEKSIEFKQFQDKIQSLINSSINIYDYVSLSSSLKSTGDLLSNLRDALKDLKTKPKDAKYREEVRTKISLLEAAYIEGINSSSKSDHLIEELPLYTLFAQGYLTLLRDVAISGKKWGFGAATITTYSERFYEKRTQFIDHCMSTYTTGINKIISISPEDDIQKFNKVLSFRSLMTYHVFDFVHLWIESMDFKKYPNGCSFENTRYLFTEVVGMPIREGYVTSPSYYTSFYNELVTQWTKRDVELYKKDLKTVIHFKETSNNNFYIQTRCVYSNDAQPNGEKNGEKCGSEQGSEPSYVSSFILGEEQTVCLNGDLLPRKIEYSKSSNSHALNNPYNYKNPYYEDEVRTDWFMHTKYPTGFGGGGGGIAYFFPGQIQDTSTWYAPAAKESCVNRFIDKFTTYGWSQHKVSTVFGFGENKDPMISLYSKRVGYLDSTCVGFTPCRNTRYNIVSNIGTTVISSQKFFDRSSTDKVSFSYDFVNNPKFWESTMSLMKGSYISYSADAPDSSKWNIFFIGVRCNSTDDTSLSIRCINSNRKQGTLDIKKGDNGEYYSTFAVNLALYKFGKHRYEFTLPNALASTKVDFKAILFKPAPEGTPINIPPQK